MLTVNGSLIIYHHHFKLDLRIDVNGTKADVFLKANAGVKLLIKLKLSGSAPGKICCLLGAYSQQEVDTKRTFAMLCLDHCEKTEASGPDPYGDHRCEEVHHCPMVEEIVRPEEVINEVHCSHREVV